MTGNVHLSPQTQRSSAHAFRSLGWAVACSALTAVLVHLWGNRPDFQTATEWSQFGGTIASIAATMLGFMLAALAILASINGTPVISAMRGTGHYEELLARLLIGSAIFLCCSVAGFALLFGAPAQGLMYPLVVGLHVAALYALIDVGHKLRLVLRNLG